eukprot:TRINITY_DN54270_c0_g1_i1.p1 TRINITY_DN54270_c0_g1~~TRINITY_DN54270_c0_g1_i1.p1  ORF type:complete len:497 (-),score=102.81 TRINITY_DN54270_c0_g1_i1:23-1318(-)
MTDFGGQNVAPAAQQKRYDAWNRERNGFLRIVLNERAMLAQREAPLSDSGSVSKSQAWPTSLSAEQVLAQRVEKPHKHVERFQERYEQLQQRKRAEKDLLEKVYDNINLREQMYRRDQEAKAQALLEQQRKYDELAASRRAKYEQHEASLRTSAETKLYHLTLRKAHTERLIGERDQAMMDRSVTLYDRKVAKRDTVLAAKAAECDRATGCAMQKLQKAESGNHAAKEQQEQAKLALHQRALLHEERIKQAQQREHAARVAKEEQYEARTQEQERRVSASLDTGRSLMDDIIRRRRQRAEERQRRVLQTQRKQERKRLETLADKLWEAQLTSEKQLQRKQEEQTLKKEELSLHSQHVREAALRVRREREWQESERRAAIEEKYERLRNVEQRQSEVRAQFAPAESLTIVTSPAPPATPKSTSPRAPRPIPL